MGMGMGTVCIIVLRAFLLMYTYIQYIPDCDCCNNIIIIIFIPDCAQVSSNIMQPGKQYVSSSQPGKQ